MPVLHRPVEPTEQIGQSTSRAYKTAFMSTRPSEKHWPLLAIVVTLSIALALTIYYLFERPVAEVLRDRLIIARTPQNSART